jgi:hypothetical protein
MDRTTRPPHRQNRLVGATAVVVGASLVVLELSKSLYVLAATLTVGAVVWPMVRAKIRNSSRVKKRITLVAAIAIGFWVCTTTALRFADSSDSEPGNGTASLVRVNPWGGEMSARDLLIHGIVSTIALGLLAHGLLAVVKTDSRRRRGKARTSGNDPASSVATRSIE